MSRGVSCEPDSLELEEELELLERWEESVLDEFDYWRDTLRKLVGESLASTCSMLTCISFCVAMFT